MWTSKVECVLDQKCAAMAGRECIDLVVLRSNILMIIFVNIVNGSIFYLHIIMLFRSRILNFIILYSYLLDRIEIG